MYQAGIPRSVLMENANKIKHMTWLITAGALFLGLLAGLVLAYRNSMPINRLLAVMKEQFGKEDSPERNEFDFLSGNIADMITKNKLLETELNRQLPLVRDAFLKRLIAGEFESGRRLSRQPSRRISDWVKEPGMREFCRSKGIPVWTVLKS